MAPRKFTVKPSSSKKEKEKKMQNHMNAADLIPLVLQIRNKKNRNNKNAVSDAAAIERICLTSPGCGRNVVDAIALGVLIIKLPGPGFNSGKLKPEFPCSVLNAFCFSTTACGKSKAGEMYRSVKNNIPLIKYVPIKINAVLF